VIRRIEALNYRCLRHIDQELDPLQVLVGPNASGKSTFLDVVAFMGDLAEGGLEKAIGSRTQNFYDLVWGREGRGFELAVELRIPDDRKQLTAKGAWSTVRYEVAIGNGSDDHGLEILGEKVLLKEEGNQPGCSERMLFPVEPAPPDTLMTPSRARGTKLVVSKVPGGNDNFYSETHEGSGTGWTPSFKLGPKKSALRNLPADESDFPVAVWLRDMLTAHVQPFVLNSQLMRRASPPGLARRFRSDGSNLPWVVQHLSETAPERLDEWIAHMRTALPDVRGVRTVERPDDRHRYLMVEYDGGLEVPSWAMSDGTLRLMALTLPAYLPDFSGIYLIEEPENGIHPKAAEAVFQSLSSVYDAQILMATHSPVILSIASARQVLCFSKTASGATDIVRGTDHPNLRDWQGETNLGVLFAGGVLG